MEERHKGFFPAYRQGELPSVELPVEGCYLLLADLHLGDGGPTDLFDKPDDDLVEIIASLSTEVDAVVLAGDVLDSTQAARPDAIASAHRTALECLRELQRNIPVHFIAGNHDSPRFVHQLLPGCEPLSSVRIGEEALVLHGHEFDAYFHDGPLTGRGDAALKAHAAFERLTRSFVRLPFRDHDNLANRFAHWVFYRYTQANRLAAEALARLGREDRLRSWAAHHDYWARSQWGDSQALLLPALATLARGPQRVLIAGHSHQAGKLARFDGRPTERVSGEPEMSWRDDGLTSPEPELLRGKVYANLGSWTFDQASYGLWRGGEVEILDWRRRAPIGDRSYRMALNAAEIPGMREWWQRYYRGLLRYDTGGILQDTAVLWD
ncbi:MAG: metallophosphoesterase family protein [Deltaproteobacteria bacterium]|nr:metallophosphoesterase family protein [Deltaproteobacteria bacterium]